MALFSDRGYAQLLLQFALAEQAALFRLEAETGSALGQRLAQNIVFDQAVQHIVQLVRALFLGHGLAHFPGSVLEGLEAAGLLVFHLDDVQAERTAHGLGHLPGLQGKGRVLKRLYRLAGGNPAQFAAGTGRIRPGRFQPEAPECARP